MVSFGFFVLCPQIVWQIRTPLISYKMALFNLCTAFFLYFYLPPISRPLTGKPSFCTTLAYFLAASLDCSSLWNTNSPLSETELTRGSTDSMVYNYDWRGTRIWSKVKLCSTYSNSFCILSYSLHCILDTPCNVIWVNLLTIMLPLSYCTLHKQILFQCIIVP